MSQMESPSCVVPREGGEEGVASETEAFVSPARLAELRKKVLRSMLEQLYLVEVAGGMRSICFMKVHVQRCRARCDIHVYIYTHSYTLCICTCMIVY